MKVHIRLERLQSVHHNGRNPALLIREVGSRILQLADDADRANVDAEQEQRPQRECLVVLTQPRSKLVEQSFVPRSLATAQDQPVRCLKRVLKTKRSPLLVLIDLYLW